MAKSHCLPASHYSCKQLIRTGRDRTCHRGSGAPAEASAARFPAPFLPDTGCHASQTKEAHSSLPTPLRIKGKTELENSGFPPILLD